MGRDRSADRLGGRPAVRSFHHSAFPVERVRDERTGTISVCILARECEETIEPIAATMTGLRGAGAVDEVIVVDAASHDATATLAERAGAEVRQEAELAPEHGPVLGKGDAMWRALPTLTGDVVCFIDGDSTDAGAHYACGLAGAVACEPGVRFAKAFYRRPFRIGDTVLAQGGGRVNELTARPLLARFYPELAAVRQPLAGEVAARRDLLERLPFATGYAVEIAMLIDAYREVGLEALSQVDLDVRQNAHQPLDALSPMAGAVLSAVTARLAREGRLVDAGEGAVVERPPVASLGASGRS
ncbi:MAG: glucosyl-3-phosphoglycerate synthase [Actinomycetota bacterium]|nr:glucosyl-3-phosphoglycerate synthase [Actinomycetota bacterium]